jgi:catechol 2,3-dioxygenase-like lactoylglutathione lyase family enzyme
VAGLDGDAIPTLPSRDLDATAAFYGALGFTAGDRYPDYLEIWRDDVELHFFVHADLDPARSDHGCYLRVSDAEAVYDEWAEVGLPADGIPRLTMPADTDYGMREFVLVDADGSLLKVGNVRPGR